jgi:hypothetical protein
MPITLKKELHPLTLHNMTGRPPGMKKRMKMACTLVIATRNRDMPMETQLHHATEYLTGVSDTRQTQLVLFVVLERVERLTKLPWSGRY